MQAVPDALNLLVRLVIAVRIFNDAKQCNAPGASSTKTPPFDRNKPACAEGVNAVKQLRLPKGQGQRLLVINSANAAIAIPPLQHRSSLIWGGGGYSVVDPETMAVQCCFSCRDRVVAARPASRARSAKKIYNARS